MARTQIEQKLFENDGAGPKIREDILPLATAATPGAVRPGTGLKVAEDGALSVAQLAAYTLTITTSGAWTAPYDGYYLEEIVGGGGPGGGVYPTAACLTVAGGGSSGGYLSQVRYHAKGETISATIGARGIGAVAGSGNPAGLGTNGGATTFGGVSAPGGRSGTGLYGVLTASMAFLGPGGAPAGQGSFAGGNGRYRTIQNTGVVVNGYSGTGGSSPYGTPGEGVLGTMGSGYSIANPATGYGSGGSGAAAGGVGAVIAGGNGAPGVVIITYLGV